MASRLTLPFRAVRFASHLATSGHKAHLCSEVIGQLASMLCFPLWRVARIPLRLYDHQLTTKHPVACESPDHLHPHGTSENTRRSYSFVLRASAVIQGFRFLDVGCAHGALVEDMQFAGWDAVGLEGSDYNRLHKRGSWPKLDGKSLFTCDIEKHFQIDQDWKADLITAWHVMEHLSNSGVMLALTNIRRHMHKNTVLIISTANNSDMKDGVELHQTQWPKSLWYDAFHSAGLHSIPDPFPVWSRYRNSPDGLDFALSRRTMAGDTL